MTTFKEAVELFLAVDRSYYTNRNYRVLLNRVMKEIDGQRDITSITYADLSGYLQAAQARKLKRSSLTNYVTLLKTLFKWCHQIRLIEHSPASELRVRNLQPEPVKSRAIPADLLWKITSLAFLTSPRNYAILLFLIDTGARVGGTTSLTFDHLDLDNHTALLLEKGSKWVRVYFGPKTALALRAYIAQRPKIDHNYVFAGDVSPFQPLTRQALAVMMRDLCRRVNAPRTYGPHSIRHAVAESLAAAGVSASVVQRKLGHTHPSTTLKYYFPHSDDHVEAVSRDHSLAPLREPEEETDNEIVPNIINFPRK